MNLAVVTPWGANWAWGFLLIFVTVAIHSMGLGLINQRVSDVLDRHSKHRLPLWASMSIMGSAALGATVLHGFEGAIWAVAYNLLGALPDRKAAILYSLNAMTSYGHADISLESSWQLLGALEALSGWILFGLTAAFLFAVVQRLWPDTRMGLR